MALHDSYEYCSIVPDLTRQSAAATLMSIVLSWWGRSLVLLPANCHDPKNEKTLVMTYLLERNIRIYIRRVYLFIGYMSH
jgi:hypothetical protein